MKSKLTLVIRSCLLIMLMAVCYAPVFSQGTPTYSLSWDESETIPDFEEDENYSLVHVDPVGFSSDQLQHFTKLSGYCSENKIRMKYYESSIVIEVTMAPGADTHSNLVDLFTEFRTALDNQ